ncbi:GFA family protein [Rhodomicrobium sp. R_RK_3]|nr:GFA family protein [Rhodomicrobium sp. R_RK_3]
MDDERHTGGCQCGAVRYAFSGEPIDPHICHCRMCQKAFGGLFAPLAGVTLTALEWTRGQPALYRSSNIAERGFCAACGTPLSFRYLDSDMINVSIGSLDHPAEVKPGRQYGMESRLPWIAELAGLPGTVTEDDLPADLNAKKASAQHPDHD